jgi:HNH endonuclease
MCGCGCGQRVAKTTSRYRPGHNPQDRGGKITLWKPAGKKKHRYTFRDRQGKTVMYARAVMEAHLRRHLVGSEVVHHINGDSTDDRIENLRLFASHSEHMRAEYATRRLPAMH